MTVAPAAHPCSRVSLVAALREVASPAPGDPTWPTAGWSLLQTHGVLHWPLPREAGGAGCSARDLLAGCLDLARGSLTTAFIYSQHLAACQRLRASPHPTLWTEWSERLAAEPLVLTIGVSHLTTSRQHLGRPAVRAEPDGSQWRLNGEIPWVTAASRAVAIVTGATLPDSRQILALVSTRQPGVLPAPPPAMVALSGSLTAPVTLQEVVVAESQWIQPPATSVMKTGSGPTAGSLTTSALALGHTWHLLDHLVAEGSVRPEIGPLHESLRGQAARLEQDLFTSAGDDTCGGVSQGPERLRARANSLVLRTAQVALAVTKGAGFQETHPIGRLAREALFFLVWSCPQPVLAVNLAHWLVDPLDAAHDPAV